jgi:hypothetical protein
VSDVETTGTGTEVEEPIKDTDELSSDTLIQLTKEQLEAVVRGITKEYDEKLARAEDRVEALRLKLEKDEAVARAKRGGIRPGIRVVSRPDPMECVFGPHKTDKSAHYRGCNWHRAEIRALRRAQGWEPVLDENGNEVRYADTVLAKMPEDKYREEIQRPKDERKASARGAAIEQFRTEAEKYGVQVDGTGITYDKVIPEEEG